MPKKMDPNMKIVREIKNAIAQVEHAAAGDAEDMVISKGGRSALTRIMALASSIEIPSEVKVAAILGDRKARAEEAKRKEERARAREEKRAAATGAAPADPVATKSKRKRAA